MPRQKHVSKALAYITHGERVLLLGRRGRPEQGIQVPGGSVEPGEALEAAALREAQEETGLDNLSVRSYLGSVEYRLKVDVGPPHLRHFFHLVYAGPVIERWERVERSEGGRESTFELWWTPLSEAKLDWEMDHYLEALRRKLSSAG